MAGSEAETKKQRPPPRATQKSAPKNGDAEAAEVAAKTDGAKPKSKRPKKSGQKSRDAAPRSRIAKATLEELKSSHGIDLKRRIRNLYIDCLGMAATDKSWVAFERMAAQVLELDLGVKPDQPRTAAQLEDDLVGAVTRLPGPIQRKVLRRLHEELATPIV